MFYITKSVSGQVAFEKLVKIDEQDLAMDLKFKIL